MQDDDQTPQNYSSIRLADVPQRVIDEIGEALNHYLIPMGVLRNTGGEPAPFLIGSGTPVRIDNSFHILTAAHVWDEIKQATAIHFVVTNRRPSQFVIPSKHMSARLLASRPYTEWGPDLALIDIPESDARTIEAHKSFVNLRREKAFFEEEPPKIERGLWAVAGMVNEFSSQRADPSSRTLNVDASGQALVSTICGTHDSGDFDYFDVGANLALSGVPSSFGGVSGGGLWQIELSIRGSEELKFNGKKHFRGVAFWESRLENNRGAIRCHGPRSLFHAAWRNWGL